MSLSAPHIRDRSLKRNQWLAYARLLRAMYQLRREGKFVIGWRLLTERTSLGESHVSNAALDLRHNGFFDTRSREIGVISLSEEQFDDGHLRAQARLALALIRTSWLWKLLALTASAIAAFLLWLVGNLTYDLLKLAYAHFRP